MIVAVALRPQAAEQPADTTGEWLTVNVWTPDTEARTLPAQRFVPFVTVVQCPQAKMLEAIGPTLVCSAITEDRKWQRQLLDATHIDRLNLGPVPTIKLNWLQPHEGSIVDFLFRARAFQFEGPVSC